MKKILFRKLLKDYLVFFCIALISASIVIWVFQAVNFLDIIIEDGRNYLIYIKFSILNFPKILSKLMPFVLFFSLFYVTIRHELNNELMILWNFGINKIDIVNFYLKFSLIILLLQILFTSYLVPKSQDIARSYLRTSTINFYGNFIKPQKFNDTIKGTTIYTEKKDIQGNFKNIFIKKEKDPDNFQTIHAKKGILEEINGVPYLVLFNGENIKVNNNKITTIGFSKFNFALNASKTNTTTYIKTQELPSLKLIECMSTLYKIKLKFIKSLNTKIENCSNENKINILREIYKRLLVPIYIPILTLIPLLLIITSKENIHYFKIKILVFLLGLFTVIFSETTIRFIDVILINNIKFIFIPFAILFIIYITFIYYFRLKFKINI
ncbi:LptF/LptG family permease [Candidatus Pelagibacter sp. HIMB1509]|uniref:LptF/LptG family permease n=1 Tax=Candidatus Pelagibacter sp. HIMB1509 TaxID=3413339 RepID=UPI003F87902E